MDQTVPPTVLPRMMIFLVTLLAVMSLVSGCVEMDGMVKIVRRTV